MIAQSAFLCSLFALLDSLSKSFFALGFPLLPSFAGWAPSTFANCEAVGTAADPGFVEVGSFPSVDWLYNDPRVVNMRSCVVAGLVHGARPVKLGCVNRAGRQHGDRAALSSMAAG